ncbi:MAG: glycosyltransferase [Polyangiaceae bacterium]
MGKSMMFSRATFESLGGFRRVAVPMLAEDYVMGKLFQHGGYRVRIAPTVLDNVTRGMTLRGFVQRQQRLGDAALALAARGPAPRATSREPLALFPSACLALGPAAAIRVDHRAARVARRRRLGRSPWLPRRLAPRSALAAAQLFLLFVLVPRPPQASRHLASHRVRLGAGTLVFVPAQGNAR